MAYEWHIGIISIDTDNLIKKIINFVQGGWQKIDIWRNRINCSSSVVHHSMYTRISKVLQLSWSIRQQTLEESLEYTRQRQEHMSCVIKFLESKKNIKKSKHTYFFLTYKKVSALVTTSYSNNWVKIINLIWHRKFTLLQSSFSANK